MRIFWLGIIAIVTFENVNAIKVNMQGSIKLGKDVMDTINHYFLGSARRAIPFVETNETAIFVQKKTVQDLVNETNLCDHITLCKNGIGETIETYAVDLGTKLQNVLQQNVLANETQEGTVFEEVFNASLIEFRTILENADEINDTSTRNEAYANIIKHMSATIQITFLENKIKHNYNESTIIQVLAELSQLEYEMELKMCAKHNICRNSFPCTEMLDTVLEILGTKGNDKLVEVFLKDFTESFIKTKLYSGLRAKETFKKVLNELSSNVGPAITIMNSLRTLTQNRLNQINDHSSENFDIVLFNLILSDMDHAYSDISDPFGSFIDNFKKFTNQHYESLGPELNAVMGEIGMELMNEPSKLRLKLFNEIDLFLISTLDKS